MTLKIILLFIFSVSAFSEVTYINRSPRGLLMGDAYTSIANDEYTLYYNPALMARHKGFSFTPFNPSFTVTNVLSDPDQFSDLPDDPIELAGEIMNTPIHIGVNAAPGFKMGNFGFSAIVNNDTNITLQNKTTPTMDIDHRFDRGFVAGYGHDVAGSEGNHVAVGFGIKYLEREGIFSRFPLLGTSLLNAVSAEKTEDILEELGQVKGRAWGLDFGMDWYQSTESGEVGMGFSIMDLYTKFTPVNDGNSTDNSAADKFVKTQPVDVNLGTHWTQNFGPFSFSLSGDLRSLQETTMPFLQRVRLGFEVDFRVIGLMGGWNAGYYSYGAKVNLGFLELYAGFYDFELGQSYQEQRGSHILIYLSLFSFTFDASG